MAGTTSTPVALTVAGSDSGGGAGIQADLKTFHALGVFGASAITCVTAQNPQRVSAVQPIRPAIVTAQIDRVFEAFPVAAVKTGMLFNAAIINAVAAALARQRCRRLVVDPVMIATSGAVLLQPAALRALRDRLLPLATLVTPNLAEAETLADRRIRSVTEQRAAARWLADRFGVAFLVKGGHLPVNGAVRDVLWDGRELHEFRSPFIARARPHGAGCAFSAAIAAHLARGATVADAVRRAKPFIQRAIRDQLRLGRQRALRV